MEGAEFLSLLHDIDHITRVFQGEFDQDNHSVPEELLGSLREVSKQLHSALARDRG